MGAALSVAVSDIVGSLKAGGRGSSVVVVYCLRIVTIRGFVYLFVVTVVVAVTSRRSTRSFVCRLRTGYHFLFTDNLLLV